MAQHRCPNCGTFMLTGGEAENCFPKKFGLTKRQKQCLDFIKDFKAENGIPPSIREMTSHLGLSGPGKNIDRILGCLEARGHIRRNAYKARDLEIL